MSRGFIKEGDQEAVPMVPPRAYLPEGVPNYVTKEGLAALNEELESLEAERAKAGDNYILDNFIEAKMKLLIQRISSAVEVDLSKANKAMVSFGAWVRYNGRVVRIVGVDEADVNKGLISFTSPLAKSLIGKKAGDVIELKGADRITVEEVSYEPLVLTQPFQDKRPETTVSTERTNKKKSVPIDLIRQEEQEEGVVSSAEAENPCSFEPEVNLMEFLPVVNERGNIVGRALYMELHNGNRMLHPVAHLHVINGQGETLRRYWWHVAFGDTPEKTLQRKLSEALGLSGVKPLLKRQYIRESKTERELVYVFTLVSEENLPKNPENKNYIELFEKDGI